MLADNDVLVEEGQLGGIRTNTANGEKCFHKLLWQTLISVHKSIDMNFFGLSDIFNVSYSPRL